MIKQSEKDTTGSSFFDVTLSCTPQQLFDLIGPPQWGNNDGRDKINFDWVCETSTGILFTIYDWKYYRPLQFDEIVEFHIGGWGFNQTLKAAEELELGLDKLK